MSKTETAPNNGAKTNDIIAGLSLLGIGLYLVFHYALDIGHEDYSLSLTHLRDFSLSKLLIFGCWWFLFRKNPSESIAIYRFLL